MYTQLAREGVLVTQDGDTELSLILPSRQALIRSRKELNYERQLLWQIMLENIRPNIPLTPYT